MDRPRLVPTCCCVEHEDNGHRVSIYPYSRRQYCWCRWRGCFPRYCLVVFLFTGVGGLPIFVRLLSLGLRLFFGFILRVLFVLRRDVRWLLNVFLKRFVLVLLLLLLVLVLLIFLVLFLLIFILVLFIIFLVLFLVLVLVLVLILVLLLIFRRLLHRDRIVADFVVFQIVPWEFLVDLCAL